jgi:NDP-sugar pyrophosphorylase family protein
MKAIILAAGKGERLKSIVSQIPKPMIKFKGKPVLQHNIELCKNYGIEEIFINLHHLPNVIADYFGNGEKYGVKIHYSYEDVLLGTAGAVKRIATDYLLDKSSSKSKATNNNLDPFFVIYGDQISGFDLLSLKEKYDDNNCLGVIAFHYRKDVQHSGVAELGDDNRVIKFIEKPKSRDVNSHWVNAGVYFLNPDILKFIPIDNCDFGKDVFPYLLSKNYPLYGVCKMKNVFVFDTPEMYSNTFRKYLNAAKE